MKSRSHKTGKNYSSAARPVVMILTVLITAAGLSEWFMLNQSRARQKQALGHGISYQDIPGLELSTIPLKTKVSLLARLNRDECTCDCKMTVAHCRHVDPKCPTSLDACQRIARTFPASRGDVVGSGPIR